MKTKTKGDIIKAMELLMHLSKEAEYSRQMYEEFGTSTDDEKKEKMLSKIIDDLDRAYYSLCRLKNL